MRRITLAVFGALALNACATGRWSTITPGTTRTQALATLGEPVGFSRDGQGQTVLSWQLNEYTNCAATFDSTDTVAAKACTVDQEAKARADARDMAALQMYMQMQAMQPRQPAYTPMKIYQAPRPTQTNCSTRWVGGVAQTDCNSRLTGFDTSIYQ